VALQIVYAAGRVFIRELLWGGALIGQPIAQIEEGSVFLSYLATGAMSVSVMVGCSVRL
jgi:hypothetical protein